MRKKQQKPFIYIYNSSLNASSDRELTDESNKT